jgi:hypothetical protein
MREILYIQAGQLSNYIGTHFWNTQQCYFTYEDDQSESAEPLTEHDRSFREGVDSKVRYTTDDISHASYRLVTLRDRQTTALDYSSSTAKASALCCDDCGVHR